MNNKMLKSILASSALLNCLAFAQVGTEVHSGYWVNIALDSTDTEKAVITLRLSTSSWMGIVLGDSGMTTGADMIQVDGANQLVYDKISSGYQYPSSDTQQDLTATWTDIGNDVMEVVIERALDTGDS